MNSLAVCKPKRQQASSRDGGGVVNRPRSPLSMLLSLHTKRQEVVATGGTATRRQFIVLAASAAANIGWPYAAWAEEPARVYRIAILAPSEGNTPAIVAFFDELRLNGFSEGQNLSLVVDGFDIRKSRSTNWSRKPSRPLPMSSSRMIKRCSLFKPPTTRCRSSA
jgi:hypothetical protein